MEIKNLQSYERVDQFVFPAKSLDKVRQLLKNRDELCVNAFKQKCQPQVTAFRYDNFSR